ncbi:unnamed protein product [Nesidiocoris tenuis]|uniref:Uncharacterized protein n=1 Tax=Nesidiocoris tenuis TaxID=355587 RepID=A0A6H5GIG1_9HEMI|nr:unnamed protein product [Nesidiocoris tenuis]
MWRDSLEVRPVVKSGLSRLGGQIGEQRGQIVRDGGGHHLRVKATYGLRQSGAIFQPIASAVRQIFTASTAAQERAVLRHQRLPTLQLGKC